jgi:S1-C subfamily serine protease
VDYSFGSGVILSQDGYIVTNHHVIDGADKIRVTFSDGSEAQATLIGSDEYSDIALLKLDEAMMRWSLRSSGIPMRSMWARWWLPSAILWGLN